MRTFLVLMLLASSLAGCAEAAEPSPEDQFDDVDLKATETTGVIRGLVVDSTIVPIADATVTIASLGIDTTTDAQGLFWFEDLEPGTYFLEATKDTYDTVQSSVVVEAGVDRPDIVRMLIDPIPGLLPYVDALVFKGHLTCGAAVVYTSVGCTTFGFIADQVGDSAIWAVEYSQVPHHVQGELVWKDTQTLSGNFIWQIVQHNYPGSPQPHIGYMETTDSPALAYVPYDVTQEYADWILEEGLDYRFFAGPHELCPRGVPDPSVNRFGCGVTIEQDAEAFIHQFYNFSPAEGWRFTSDGEHPIPS